MKPTEPRTHIMTVNLEDYYHVDAFNKFVQHNRWQRFESRIEFATDRTLDLLAKNNAKATFFVLGWVAEQFPDAIRKVAAEGHELAVRGFYHRSVRDMTPVEFRLDTLQAREVVEQITGTKVFGYRVADNWFDASDLWALDILAELGFVYDSSIAPIRRLFADDPRRLTPHVHRNGKSEILELPISTGKILGVRVPVAGGNYLRQIPRFLTRRAAARWVKSQTQPMMAYFHAWELDPDQPRLTAGGRLTHVRHYRNLAKMPARIADMLKSYKFGSCADFLNLQPEMAPARVETPRPGSHTPPSILPLRRYDDNTPRTPVTIVVPCYNEELLIAHLKNTLDEVRDALSNNYDVHYMLVDDGSSDGTWNRMQAAFGNLRQYRMTRHDVNLGVAAAIGTGIRLAETEIVASMDSDCSYDPLKLAEMIPMLVPGVDLVTASPYHPAGAVKNVPKWRLTLSKGCAWLYRRVLSTKLHTYTSCFRVYRRSTVAAIQLNHCRFLGVAELVGRLDLAKKKIVEFPAILECRTMGRSKMKTVRTVLGHLGLMFRLTIDRLRQDSSPDRDDVIRSQIKMVPKTITDDFQNTPEDLRRTPQPVNPREMR